MTGNAFTPNHIPVEINYLKDDRILEIIWDDDQNTRLSAELLRVESPSAEVQGHHPSEKRIISGRKHVGIIDIEPVGQYAIKITFDDLHDSGIYSWHYLRELHENQDKLWQDYEQALKDRRLSREPRKPA
ncbi:gamma-butyrobetaine hydroxylase-like domain-containing protein [Thalassospira sp.]|uniref:gamma-butyrobetaine hydroxylase-like domain-containing protein n=1 Tax=Thalassospira sp. TaxID=1912094 RepID=UPI003AA850EE